MTILIDFDGTCVAHEFPKVGRDIGAVPVLKKLVANGHQLILFTMRGKGGGDMTGACEENPHIKPGDFLTDAVNWFKKNDIPLYGINTNPTQKAWTSSPKAYGHLLIDDIALGVPLVIDPSTDEKPYVDWEAVEHMLKERGLIT